MLNFLILELIWSTVSTPARCTLYSQLLFRPSDFWTRAFSHLKVYSTAVSDDTSSTLINDFILKIKPQASLCAFHYTPIQTILQTLCCICLAGLDFNLATSISLVNYSCVAGFALDPFLCILVRKLIRSW